MIALGDSAAVAHALAPSLVAGPTASERPITVDQTNCSVVVDESVVVKWLRPPVRAPHRGATLMAHLTEVGFADTPRFLGVQAEEGEVRAVLTTYLDGAVDGWEWYVDQVTAELGAGGAARSVSTGARLGSLAGRLHQALATPSSTIPQPVGWADAAGEHTRALALWDAALAVADGDAAGLLQMKAAAIRASLDRLASAGPLDVQHIHGDLHVGQVLRRHDRLAVIDFDGNPVAGEGDDPLRSPMVDLASLVQSVDHVGRVVARRQPDLAPALDEFIADATSAVVAAYAREGDVDLSVLDALRTAQELHELVYTAKHLPRWQYVPTAALAARFG